jgi:hypothetical protein
MKPIQALTALGLLFIPLAFTSCSSTSGSKDDIMSGGADKGAVVVESPRLNR